MARPVAALQERPERGHYVVELRALRRVLVPAALKEGPQLPKVPGEATWSEALIGDQAGNLQAGAWPLEGMLGMNRAVGENVKKFLILLHKRPLR